MANIFQQFDILSFVPAIGAALLSIWNWLVLRRGAMIKAGNIVNYGIWGISRENRKTKILFFPVMLVNEGSKAGMVTDLKISFNVEGEKSGDLEIRRKVKLKDLPASAIRSMAATEYTNSAVEEINPFYPISINSMEDNSVLIECFDGKNIIPIGQESICTVEVHYGINKSTRTSFPFFLSEENFTKSLDAICWLRTL